MTLERAIQTCSQLESTSVTDVAYSDRFMEYQEALKDLLDEHTEPILLTSTIPRILVYDLFVSKKVHPFSVEELFRTLSPAQRCRLASKDKSLRFLLKNKELKKLTTFDLCPVCLECNFSIPLRGCTHMLCKNCYPQLVRDNTVRCPMCRTLSTTISVMRPER